MRDIMDQLTGTHGYATLVQVGFKKSKTAPAIFANGCHVTMSLQDGSWEVCIVLPNHEVVYVYATPDNVETDYFEDRKL